MTGLSGFNDGKKDKRIIADEQVRTRKEGRTFSPDYQQGGERDEMQDGNQEEDYTGTWI